ncbi:helicase-exonuclease AddAB subunit AddB [Ornithinibacillus halotolerans]|uniref:ATP-dependent helicase/deoxyribonuclease subunit B n=1 Tax=Ornithinibacillus halotolerans TaxID=1274357 RepID=A0A916RXA1_9BACI|nr:helicase-exonuclease AddAB subunit AddB [Ornithinibacillus halotolerans]GGA73725.1 ATP-dependent helicase/deoxyribonuclease subunit B [Ornithinibacillus halotolerans]
MGLRFILGRAGTEKSKIAFEEIKENSNYNPQGPPIFYIVPDQMTFEQEYALFRDEAFQGSIRTQVTSFSRLAWLILQETGGATRQFISSVGIQMMLKKIIDEKEGEWQVFQKAVEKQGFLNQLEKVITEFKRYEVTPDMLQMQKYEINQYAHKEPGEQALVNKLDDLYYIYDKLQMALANQYIDSEDQLRLLAEKIAEANSLEGAEIYFDGFHRFTPKELIVVEALLKKCERVTVTLTVDDTENPNLSEMDLFYQTKETYHVLNEIARVNGITVENSIELEPANGVFYKKPYFAHLERYFDTRPTPTFEGKVPIQIAEAVHPRAEIEGVAQEILRLVREENYRYRDIAILIRQTETYQDIIGTIFADYNIPVFIDEKRTMLNHSLIEFLRSCLEVVDGNFRYDAVFRMLKTGFIPAIDEEYPLTSDAIDELENYVIEYGIRSRKQWMSKEDWIFQRFHGFDQKTQTDAEKETQIRINRYRMQIVHALEKFDQKIREASTIREICTEIFTLLEDIQAPEQLEKMRNYLDEHGQLSKGREQEQVWNAIIDLFDEMVEMAGDEQMTLSSFRSTLDAGLETLKFSHVPPSIDHVIVGTIDRSRISGIKCSFLVGVNDGVWPLKPPADGMINETERELLATHGMKLADTSKRQLLDDWFYMYLAFCSASDYLWVSYPLSDEEGKAKMPSQLIKRIEDMFPDNNEHLLLQDPDELYEADRFITSPIKTRSALTAQLARGRKGYPVKEVWWHVLNWYMTNHKKQHTTHKILQSLFYENSPSHLEEETVEHLYPKEVVASVSRLETYYRCSYQHFAKYSLGLKERKTYKLDAPDIGNLFHEALRIITEWVQQEGKDFARLTKKETDKYAEKAVTSLAPILQHQILHSSNRYQYIQHKLQQVIARAAYVLSEQARLSNFSPVGLELGFGTKQDKLAPVTLELPNGYEIKLRGRIDRVDRALNEEELYLRIIDYKSSARGLDMVEVYYGLALQMLTYLDVVLSQSEQWLGKKATPAGVLYFHVHNPMISGTFKMSDEELEEEIFKKYKMQGLLINQENVVQMMDTSLESGFSQIIPAALKKDGNFRSGSKIASEETFSSLQEHIRKLMLNAGIDMTEGAVHLNPYQRKQQVACTYCPFLSVCQFDTSLETNNYRKLTEMKEDEVIQKLRKKEGDIIG